MARRLHQTLSIRGGKSSKKKASKKSKPVDKLKIPETLVANNSSVEHQSVLDRAVLSQNFSSSKFIVDESQSDDHTAVYLASETISSLGLFSGDTVLLKGKKRKCSIGIVVEDDSLGDTRIRLNKVMRSNLRLV